mmetsp:Transcript_60361/g.179348  ORF Transcript_60361/g.179348 Transcript_60361/m.179348 type:complete len:234 (+) Transcript_60361:244-945(+)
MGPQTTRPVVAAGTPPAPSCQPRPPPQHRCYTPHGSAWLLSCSSSASRSSSSLASCASSSQPPHSAAIASRRQITSAATFAGSARPTVPSAAVMGAGEAESSSTRKTAPRKERDGLSNRGSHASSLARSQPADAAFSGFSLRAESTESAASRERARCSRSKLSSRKGELVNSSSRSSCCDHSSVAPRKTVVTTAGSSEKGSSTAASPAFACATLGLTASSSSHASSSAHRSEM